MLDQKKEVGDIGGSSGVKKLVKDNEQNEELEGE